MSHFSLISWRFARRSKHMTDSLFRKNLVSTEKRSGWRGGQGPVKTKVGLQLDY